MQDCSVYLPHAGKKLDKTAISECSSDNQVGLCETTGTQVDTREQEGGQRESAETKRSWVGELAGWRLVKTRLEVTTEGGKTNRVASVDVSERVAAVVVGLALLHGYLRLASGVVEVVAVSIDRRVQGLLVDIVVLLRSRHLCDVILFTCG